MSRRIAILIASSSFPDEPKLDTLLAPEHDVEGMRATLSHEKSGAFDDVVVLMNQPSHKVRLALNRALRAAAKEDQLPIYYSGHGKLDPTGRLCLAMTDTVLDALEASSVRVGEIKDFLDASKCRQVMLVLDCCYSGAVGKDFVSRSAVEDQLQLAAEGAGICIMSASNSVQTAMESTETGLGVFTRHLIEGIETGLADQNGDGLVTFDELFQYADKQIKAEGHQRPQHWAFQAEGNLVVARSGRSEEQRRQLRARMIELAREHDLPDEILPAALQVLNQPPSEHTPRERALLKLLEEFAGGRTKPVGFAMSWAKVSLSSDGGDFPAARTSRPGERTPAARPASPPAKPPPPAREADLGALVSKVLATYAVLPDFWMAPGIPGAKLAKARQTCGVPAGEEILGLVDCTYTGVCDDAVLFGPSVVYHHNKTGPHHGSLSYADFGDYRFKAQGTLVRTGTGEDVEIDGSSFPAERLVQVLIQIQAAIQQARRAAMQA